MLYTFLWFMMFHMFHFISQLVPVWCLTDGAMPNKLPYHLSSVRLMPHAFVVAIPPNMLFLENGWVPHVIVVAVPSNMFYVWKFKHDIHKHYLFWYAPIALWYSCCLESVKERAMHSQAIAAARNVRSFLQGPAEPETQHRNKLAQWTNWQSYG